MTDHSVMAQGGIEKIGLPGSFLKMTLPDGTKKIIEEDIPEPVSYTHLRAHET